MSTFVFVNNFSTTLAAALTSTATTVTLASSTGLPTLASGQIMPLTLNDAATGQIYEILYVTAISGATLTIERAQEGTAAQAWAIGDYAKCMPTAGTVAPVNGSSANNFAANALTAVSASVNGSPVWTEALLTNLSQLTNGPGYITAAALSAPIAQTQQIEGAAGTTESASVSFTAPANGIVVAAGSRNNSSAAGTGNVAALYVNGAQVATDNTELSTAHFGVASVTNGQTVSAVYTAGCTVAFSVNVLLVFIPNA